MMVFSEVGSVDAGESGLGVPENIAAASELTLISFPSPNYNYFRYPSIILKFSVKKASGEVGI